MTGILIEVFAPIDVEHSAEIVACYSHDGIAKGGKHGASSLIPHNSPEVGKQFSRKGGGMRWSQRRMRPGRRGAAENRIEQSVRQMRVNRRHIAKEDRHSAGVGRQRGKPGAKRGGQPFGPGSGLHEPQPWIIEIEDCALNILGAAACDQHHALDLRGQRRPQ